MVCLLETDRKTNCSATSLPQMPAQVEFKWIWQQHGMESSSIIESTYLLEPTLLHFSICVRRRL